MTWPPGWDSAAGADSWSNIYFWAGIVALFLLGAFEVASHRYTLRKDEIVTEEQDRAKRQHDEEMARLHLETAQATERNTQLEIRLEEERKSRIALQNALATPHLTPEQIDQLARAVSGRVPLMVLEYTRDASSLALAQDIKTAFDRAKVPVQTNFTGVMSPKPYGLFIFIPGEELRFISDLFQTFGLSPKVTVVPPTQPLRIFPAEKPPPF